MDCPVSLGDILADKYRVEEILGQGGMGVVVAARHLDLDQRVALKFLLPALAENDEATERFRREARAAVKIQSEHVARVLDVGSMDGGIPYMVMEFLQGRDLAQELVATGPVDVDNAASLLLDACEAIAAAHAVGIVHRDLKPSNLFVTTRPDHSRCLKVLDFGISKSLLGESNDSQFALTRTRAVVGSPLYMAPEQLESSRNADERADIWSLGVILYELLTGQVPFTGESLPQLVRAVLVGDRRPLCAVNAQLPPELEDIVGRCLAQSRDQRYPSVSELAFALAPYTAGGERSASRVSRILSRSKFKVASPEVVVPLVPTVPDHSPSASGTLSAWGHSGTGPLKRSRMGLLIGLGLVVAAAATAFFWIERSRVNGVGPLLDDKAQAVSRQTVSAVAERALQAPTDPTGGVTPSLEVVPTEGVSVPLTAQAGETAVPESSPPLNSSAATVKRPAALQAAKPPVKAHPAARGPVSSPSAVELKKKGPNFTDFGGRR